MGIRGMHCGSSSSTAGPLTLNFSVNWLRIFLVGKRLGTSDHDPAPWSGVLAASQTAAPAGRSGHCRAPGRCKAAGRCQQHASLATKPTDDAS